MLDRTAGYFAIAALLYVGAVLPETTQPDEKEAKKKVAAWMVEKAGPEGANRLPQPVRIASPALEAHLPGIYFYAVIGRQYPVAMAMPAPFATQNVVVYQKDGSVRHFASVAELKSYFVRAVPPVGPQGDAKRVVAAWLRLTQEFSQDGFFQFTVPEDQIKTEWQPSGGLVATGKAVVTPKGGDSGEIEASLTFGGQGNGPRRLVSIREKRNVKAGVRPICQATKLLDPDPIVRRMAEQDLVVMGRAAWPYLQEQREKASGKLRACIDRVWARIVAEGR